MRNIIFRWVTHARSITDELIDSLDIGDARVMRISPVTYEANLRKRLSCDIARAIREGDATDGDAAKTDMHRSPDTVKVDTSNRDVREMANEMPAL